MVAILAIRPQFLEPRLSVPTHRLEHLRSRRPVVGLGGRHRHRQQQTQRIDHKMTLPTRDFLAAVVPLRTAGLGAFDRLGVDRPRTRMGIPPGRDANPHSEGIQDPLPGSIVSPARKIIVDGALG